jgi:hypothetical protein
LTVYFLPTATAMPSLSGVLLSDVRKRLSCILLRLQSAGTGPGGLAKRPGILRPDLTDGALGASNYWKNA